jgi:hypothetical protein
MTFDKHHLRLLSRKWARNFHIYLSLFGLVLLLFFAVTGFMMNHPAWFDLDGTQTRNYSANLPLPIVQSQDKLAIVERLRKDAAVTGFLDSFAVKDTSIFLTFKSPGRQFDIEITRATGQAQITYEWHGLAARITEMHRGTDAGPAWRLVIDSTSILLITTIVTGVTLWLMVPKWRAYGITAITVCTVTCGLIYFLAIS